MIQPLIVSYSDLLWFLRAICMFHFAYCLIAIFYFFIAPVLPLIPQSIYWP
jgi:hypothetical protein